MKNKLLQSIFKKQLIYKKNYYNIFLKNNLFIQNNLLQSLFKNQLIQNDLSHDKQIITIFF